jgi:hypothetical protein
LADDSLKSTNRSGRVSGLSDCAEGAINRDGHRYAYRLTDKGIRVPLFFLPFHKRLCGALANSLFHHRPDAVDRSVRLMRMMGIEAV